MLLKRFSGSILPVIAVLAGCCLVASTQSSYKRSELASHPTLVAPKSMPYFVLGYKLLAADLLWLRTIQDFDFCENANAAPGSSVCERGWVYKMIDSVTELDPLFRMAYQTGALMLSVVVNDLKGASAIFDKSIERFPDDYQLLFYAAYHAMLEEKNEQKASELLNRAATHGGPPWLFSLSARMHQKTGQLDLAKATLESALERTNDETNRVHLQKRLDEVNAELEKERSH